MPPDIDREKMRNLVEVYRSHIEKELGAKMQPAKKISSMEYQEFKKQYMPRHLTWYERFCSLSEKIMRIKPDAKKAELMQENIDIAHLNITPSGVISFSFLAP